MGQMEWRDGRMEGWKNGKRTYRFSTKPPRVSGYKYMGKGLKEKRTRTRTKRKRKRNRLRGRVQEE